MKSYSILALLFISFSTSAFGNDCPLCDEKIIKQQTVFETEYYVVLVDYMPRMKGHLLVVPKRHVFKAHELTGQEWQDLSVVIPKVVAVFKDFLGTDQYMILEKNGPQAYQEIPHVHFHLLPFHSEKWMDVFNIKPKKLTTDELQAEVAAFRAYFLNNSCPQKSAVDRK